MFWLSYAAIYFIFLSSVQLDNVSCQNVDELGPFLEGDIAGFGKAFSPRSGTKTDQFVWPSAVIPYEFEATYPPYLKQQFLRATEYISQRTCVRFVTHTSEKDYLYIEAGKWCVSFVGVQGGRQKISLSPTCQKLGIFIHEILHSLGLPHEMSRIDRNDYVTIFWENIENGLEHNFRRRPLQKYLPSFMGYDYSSLMHYSPKAFTKNGKDTIVPKTAGVKIGQRRGMSQNDIAKLNKMYCT